MVKDRIFQVRNGLERMRRQFGGVADLHDFDTDLERILGIGVDMYWLRLKSVFISYLTV